MVDPLSTRDLIKRLGTFLADLTMDRPPARIHADIIDRLRETRQQPDPQLSGVYFDDKDFIPVWMAIRSGASLPINSWDTVVLPAIAYYSSREAFKPNMETAIHLWRQARSSLSNVLEGPSAPAIVPVYEVVNEQAPDSLEDLFSSAPVKPERAVPPPRRSGKRWLVAGLASLLIMLAAVAVVLYGNASKEPFAGTIPRNVTTGGPIEVPVADPSPFETPSPEASPTLEPSALPTGTPSAPPGVVAPTAPRAVAVTGKTDTTVTLSWQPPVNAGTRGLSHYQIFKGMTAIGTTMSTSFTISFLLPKTTYSFNVVAVNRADASSAPSNAVSVTTDSTPVGPRPPATVKTNPGPFISYGLAFSVIGDDWPCTAPAQVDVYLRNELIASPTTDSKGHFEVSIEIIFDLPNAMIPIADRQDEYLILQRDVEETIKAVLTSRPQCSSTELKSTHVTFN